MTDLVIRDILSHMYFEKIQSEEDKGYVCKPLADTPSLRWHVSEKRMLDTKDVFC